MLPKILKIGPTIQLRLNKCSGPTKRKARGSTRSNQGVFYVLPIIFLSSKIYMNHWICSLRRSSSRIMQSTYSSSSCLPAFSMITLKIISFREFASWIFLSSSVCTPLSFTDACCWSCCSREWQLAIRSLIWLLRDYISAI